MKYISVCKNIIQSNNKRIRLGLSEPLEAPIRIQEGKSGNKTTHNAVELLDINGNVVGKIFYQAEKAVIKCGAKVVIEWYGEIKSFDNT